MSVGGSYVGPGCPGLVPAVVSHGLEQPRVTVDPCEGCSGSKGVCVGGGSRQQALTPGSLAGGLTWPPQICFSASSPACLPQGGQRDQQPSPGLPLVTPGTHDLPS